MSQGEDQPPKDLYARITELPEDDLRRIADVLELRGRHPQQIAVRSAYLDLLPSWRGMRVLDVGCGTGVVSRALAGRVGPDGTVLGVDPSPVFLSIAEDLARAENLSNLRFARGDARALDLPSGSFDAAVAFTVLCHVPDTPAVLDQLARVVRPGGYVVLCDGDYAANVLEHPDRARTERIVEAWLANVVNDPRIMRRIGPLLDRAGLGVLRFQGHVHVESGTVRESDSFLWNWALFALRQAFISGAVTQREADRWIAELGELNAAGQFFGSVTYYSAIARRPRR